MHFPPYDGTRPGGKGLQHAMAKSNPQSGKPHTPGWRDRRACASRVCSHGQAPIPQANRHRRLERCEYFADHPKQLPQGWAARPAEPGRARELAKVQREKRALPTRHGAPRRVGHQANDPSKRDSDNFPPRERLPEGRGAPLGHGSKEPCRAARE